MFRLFLIWTWYLGITEVLNAAYRIHDRWIQVTWVLDIIKVVGECWSQQFEMSFLQEFLISGKRQFVKSFD